MTTRSPRRLKRSEWASHPTLWKEHVEGHNLGTNVTVLFYSTEEVGRGPRWHVHSYDEVFIIHPYDEVFIIREGRALLTVGERPNSGQIIFGPANVPHKFRNLGPGRLDTVSDRWIQTDLDDPEAEL